MATTMDGGEQQGHPKRYLAAFVAAFVYMIFYFLRKSISASSVYMQQVPRRMQSSVSGGACVELLCVGERDKAWHRQLKHGTHSALLLPPLCYPCFPSLSFLLACLVAVAGHCADCDWNHDVCVLHRVWLVSRTRCRCCRQVRPAAHADNGTPGLRRVYDAHRLRF